MSLLLARLGGGSPASFPIAADATGAGAAVGNVGRRAPIAAAAIGAGTAAGAAGASRPIAAVASGVGAANGAVGASRPIAAAAIATGIATGEFGEAGSEVGERDPGAKSKRPWLYQVPAAETPRALIARAIQDQSKTRKRVAPATTEEDDEEAIWLMVA